MKFYQVQLNIKMKSSSQNKKRKETDTLIKAISKNMHILSDIGRVFNTDYFKNTKTGTMFFIYDFDAYQKILYCGFASDGEVDEKYIMSFPWNKLGIVVNSITSDEITSKDFGQATSIAKSGGFFARPIESYLRLLNAGPLYDWREGFDGAICGFTEDVISSADSQKKEELLESAQSIMWKNELSAEINRIFDTKINEDMNCHPVHYFVESDNPMKREYAMRILLNALYKNKRITSRRISYLYVDQLRLADISYIDEMFKFADGSTVIVDMTQPVNSASGFFDEDNEITDSDGTIIELCNIIRKYRNSVLTVFFLPKQCTADKEKIYQELQDFCFVELFEDALTDDLLKAFLKLKASDGRVVLDDDIINKFSSEKIKSLDEAERVYESWYANKVKSEYYTKYSSFEMAKKYAAPERKTSAMQELDKMIGLETAKETIKQAVDFYRLQKLYKDRGINKSKPAMHMIFRGDPGTAKTTVARLFAKIMKENNVLDCGHLVECGRADLVGKYVGWTANQVKKKFQEAKGGVLFLDEAYSLVDDRDGSFGDEAINTIVQEMENHRDELIVIFAGYPDKMEEFLNKNPGLKSRIGFYIDFDNYTTADLIKITNKIAKDQDILLDKKVNKKLEDIYEKARKDRDFGNGRFVRNLIEKARLKQASRLVHSKNYENLSDKELLTLKEEDFDIKTENISKNEITEIGFKGE